MTATTNDSAGIRILTLSHSPHELATGAIQASELAPELRVGYGRPGWSGFAADIISLGDGRFAVLDRSAARIVAFDPRFAFTASRGRDGTTVVERFRLPELGCEG